MDNLKEKKPRDSSKISLEEDWEITWWTQSFGVSRKELEEAIQKVGNSVEKVKEYLANNTQLRHDI